MQFEFDGQTYRIGFHHSVSTRWEDHREHSVDLVPVKWLSHAPNKQMPRDAGPVVLVCATCTEQGKGERDAEGIAGYVRLSHCGVARHTSCRILKHRPELPETTWEIVGTGEALQNPSDRFHRETGRQLSLKRALRAFLQWKRPLECKEIPRERVKAFLDAAMKAYRERRRYVQAGGAPAVGHGGMHP